MNKLSPNDNILPVKQNKEKLETKLNNVNNVTFPLDECNRIEQTNSSMKREYRTLLGKRQMISQYKQSLCRYNITTNENLINTIYNDVKQMKMFTKFNKRYKKIVNKSTQDDNKINKMIVDKMEGRIATLRQNRVIHNRIVHKYANFFSKLI